MTGFGNGCKKKRQTMVSIATGYRYHFDDEHLFMRNAWKHGS